MLVTARRWTCQHEWVMHSKLALRGGLARGMRRGHPRRPRAEAHLAEERGGLCLLQASCTPAAGRATPRSRRIEKRFGLDGALELIALNGYYTLMAMVLNTAGLPLPGNAEPPLKPF